LGESTNDRISPRDSVSEGPVSSRVDNANLLSGNAARRQIIRPNVELSLLDPREWFRRRKMRTARGVIPGLFGMRDAVWSGRRAHVPPDQYSVL